MNVKVLGLASLIMILGGLITVNYSPYFGSSASSKPCQEPLTYEFGDIDPRFDVTEAELKEIMEQVEELWTTALDRQLLEYRNDGRVAINLVYSEDQERTEAEQSFAKRIQNQKKYIEVLKEEYENLKSRYDSNYAEYNEIVSAYNKKAETYYQLKSKWQGEGKTAQRYQRLEKMEAEAQDLKADLERRKENLQLLRQNTNAKSRQLNTLIEKQNELVTRYNRKFSDTQKFNQGRYIRKGDSEQINIFQFGNKAQLKLVLAHEAGHALGLDHVENPESIMHAIMGEQDIFNLALTDEDIEALKDRCNN